ncbi:hypothetical protein L7F22_023124 [Adiantum nelumboides]|nr:hypothetical protein [Adiantum nelumboides]
MSSLVERQAGMAHLSKHASWSSNRSTFAIVAAAAVLVLLGSILFIQSSRYLPKDLNGPTWADLQQSRNLAMITGADGQDYLSSEDEDLMLQPKVTTHSRSHCSKESALLKVFMYDLPPEFHFGMIDKAFSDQIWPSSISNVPRYPGGLNLQHSIEYWLTLDLLSSVMLDRRQGCAAILVANPKEADIFFVPYFSSLSYNKYTKLENINGTDKNVRLQEKLVHFLQRQNHWRLTGGKNHVILMHHPNSLHMAREQLCSAMFIVSDFGRYSHQVANVNKDIVAPYKHMVSTFSDDTSSFHARKTLLYFQGAIFRKEGGIIRQKLYGMLKDEVGVHFSNGTAQKGGVRSASEGMRSSKFCLHLAGDTPSSNRLFDAIVSHCVPVIISDEIELPFEDQLDYSQFCMFVTSTDALQSGLLMGLLRSVKEKEWTRKWMLLKQLDRHFEYQHPAQPYDAVNMIWRTIARKVPSVKQSLNKAKRYSRSRLFSRDKQ